MAKFDVEYTDEIISNNAGLVLIGNILTSDEFQQKILPICNDSGKNYSDYVILKCYLGMLSLGKSDFESIDNYREDPFFKQCLELDIVPSKESLRQRLELLSKESVNIAIKEFNLLVIRQYAVLTACLNTDFIPIDFDVTPFDNSGSKKEGVSLTYKKHDGYAPMMTYIGNTGFIINNEFRQGKSHSNCEGTAAYIDTTLSFAKSVTDKPLLARFDSGNDSVENIFTIDKHENVNYLIKGNMRKTPEKEFVEIAKGEGVTMDKPRLGKKVYYNSCIIKLEHKDKAGQVHHTQTRRIVRLTERTIDKHGQLLVFVEREIDFWNTDLYEMSERDVIALYADHGTSEQFHSEFKTDMDLERFPSGKFATNSLVITLGLLVFNMLRTIGQETLASGELNRKHEVKRIRIRKVIQDVMYMACKFMIRCKRKVIKITSYNPYGQSFIYACNTMFVC